MAVTLRLQRRGRKRTPQFRIVVMDARQPRDGRFIDEIGWYQPTANEVAGQFSVRAERCLHWLDNGAQFSPTVFQILLKCGIHHRRLGTINANGKVAAAKRCNKPIPRNRTVGKLTPLTEESAVQVGDSTAGSAKNANFLTEATWRNNIAQNVPRKAVRHENRNPTTDTSNKSPAPPSSKSQSEVDVPDRPFNREIIHLKDRGDADDAVKRVCSGDAAEIYVDVGYFSIEDALDVAADLHHRIIEVRPLWEPVVAGPLSSDDSESRRQLACIPVRTTTQTYEQYRADSRCNHRRRSQNGDRSLDKGGPRR